MIACINGEVLSLQKDRVVVGLGGLGIEVYAPKSVLEQYHPGEAIFLHTYLVVREDALMLFGFEKEVEREFFLLLLAVNGVGPKTALSILSTLSVDAIRKAVLSEQPDIFAVVPGIGRKGAQKIILSLQGRVGAEEELGYLRVSDVDAEIIEALTTLGYSVVEAQTALQSLPKDAPQNVEERLYMALQYFSK